VKQILGAIFGSSKNTETVVDGAVKGLDKMFFTKEERSEANQKLSEWYLKYLAATQPQNIARRFIAVIVTLLWSALIVAGIVVRWWSYEASDYVFKILGEIVMQPFSIIIGFYFLTHAVRAYKK
jgi:hypothetical protein